MSAGTFRGDPLRPTFCAESLYGDTFNLLRPSSSDSLAVSSSATLYGCGPLVNLKADVSQSWQGLAATFAVDRFNSTVAVYSDFEMRASCRVDIAKGLSAFGEGLHYPKSSLYATDLMRARVGLDYHGSGPVSSARASVTDSGNTSIGASIPFAKPTSLVLGLDATSSGFDSLTMGFKFAPCRHFQISLSNCMRLKDGSQRQTASFYAEPRPNSMIGLLAAVGGDQPSEVALGMEASFKPHESVSTVKVRSFLDAFDLTSRHELLIPYGRSFISLGVELARLEPRWTARLNVVS